MDLRTRVSSILKKKLLRDTLWMILAKFTNLVMQLSYLIIVARTLGPKNYGVFISITSFVGAFLPFASFGSGDILINQVSRDKSVLIKYWSNALLTVLASSLFLSTIVYFIITHITPFKLHPFYILLVITSDLLGVTLAFDTVSKVFAATNQIKRTAQIQVLFTFIKFFSAISFVFISRFYALTADQNIICWIICYSVSTLVSALISILLVCHIHGYPDIFKAHLNREALHGLYFSIDLSANTITANIDKTLLARLSTLEVAGIYGAAYRLLDAAFMPLLAVLATTYSKFFEQGIHGLQGTLLLAKRLLPYTSAYGLFATIGLIVFAPLLPYLFGNEYTESVVILRWLSPIILLYSMQFLAADALTGAGFQGTRSFIQIIAAVINIILNVLFIPIYSWQAAVWSTWIAEGIKLLFLWSAILIYRQKQ